MTDSPGAVRILHLKEEDHTYELDEDALAELLLDPKYNHKLILLRELLDTNQNPSIEALMQYSRKQARCTTEDFPVAPIDPRFVIQEEAPPPQPQQQPPVHQQNAVIPPQNVFIYPFFGQQQLHQPRPQLYQQPQVYQQQQLYRPPINLNQSLPVYYNHQYMQQQYPPNFNNYHF